MKKQQSIEILYIKSKIHVWSNVAYLLAGIATKGRFGL